MSKQDPDGQGWVAQEGVAANAGASVDPCALPEDDAPAEHAAPRAAPIGHPISPEEYRRLKERAKTDAARPPASAQEDPAERPPRPRT